MSAKPLTRAQLRLLRDLSAVAELDTSPSRGMVIKTLRARGLVVRTPSPFTGPLVKITDAGREALAAAEGRGRQTAIAPTTEDTDP